MHCSNESDNSVRSLAGNDTFHWEYPISYYPSGGWVMERSRACYVLHGMLMAHPIQADSLQGLHGVSCGDLAVNDLEIGSGWRQSKQTWVLPAVMGY